MVKWNWIRMTSRFRRNLRKYWLYVFDRKSFAPRSVSGAITDHALHVAKKIHGEDRKPAIVIHGIMKRSGTGYVGRLLGLHPDVHQFPGEVWEFPFLTQTGKLLDLQKDFFFEYDFNRGRIGDEDFLPLFGASLIAYLGSMVPLDRRILLKMPGVQYPLDFYRAFPYENLMLLLRDRRDVLASTIKTWPQIQFWDACQRWDLSARMVLSFDEMSRETPGYCLVKYEEAVSEPENFVEKACMRFGLDIEQYPFDCVEALPVMGSSTTRKQGIETFNKTRDFKLIDR